MRRITKKNRAGRLNVEQSDNPRRPKLSAINRHVIRETEKKTRNYCLIQQIATYKRLRPPRAPEQQAQ